MIALDISNTILRYTDNLYKEIDERFDRAVREGASRDYTQILSELLSFVSFLRKFLNSVSVLDSVYRDLKSGRICFRWLYTEDGAHISIVKLNPLIVISYGVMGIHVGFGEKGITIHGSSIRYNVNKLEETLPVNDISSIVARKSLILDVLGTLKTVLQHSVDDFIKCSKMLRTKT